MNEEFIKISTLFYRQSNYVYKMSRRKSLSGHFVLGIDVGTTSVKVCLVNVETKEVSHKFVKDTLAGLPKDVPNADLQVNKPINRNIR